MSSQPFSKKIFTPGLFFSDLGYIIFHAPGMIGVSRNPAISKAFVEKIMSVVTAVNGCVYCTWFHARQATKSGLSNEEIRNLMNLQFQADASDFELPALLYAQHFAETNRHPEDDMKEKILEFYGEKTAGHIHLVIRMIFFGNLYGNTWDAVISRFKGQAVNESSLIFEIFFFLLNFPVMFPAMLLVKKDKKKN